MKVEEDLLTDQMWGVSDGEQHRFLARTELPFATKAPGLGRMCRRCRRSGVWL